MGGGMFSLRPARLPIRVRGLLSCWVGADRVRMLARGGGGLRHARAYLPASDGRRRCFMFSTSPAYASNLAAPREYAVIIVGQLVDKCRRIETIIIHKNKSRRI